ncbi:MAG TPA: hypothetical protein VHE83_13780 [Mycobacteriales bacterium]|nr:hypothetical protein [Mycobacteriales bacterium]
MGKRELRTTRKLLRARWLVPGGVVVVGGVVAGVLLSDSNNHRSSGQPSAAQSGTGVVVSGAAGQLQQLLHRAEQRAYHATYSVTGGAKVVGTLTIEVWHAAPSAREDTVVANGTSTARTETLTDGKSGETCRRTDGPWTCTPLPAADAAEAGGVATRIVASLAGHQVAVSTETVSGEPAQCFAVAEAGGPKVCVDSHGIPLLLSDADVTYLRTALSTEVDAAVFTPPSG